MTSGFKQQIKDKKAATPPRVAIQQVDPEAPKPVSAAAVEPVVQDTRHVEPAPETPAPAKPTQEVGEEMPPRISVDIATVDSSEKTVPFSSSMRPSRKTQLEDMAYREKRWPWEIVEDALELYAVKHYQTRRRRAKEK